MESSTRKLTTSILIQSTCLPPKLDDIPKGAAVILSRFSLFATNLAAEWRKKGLEVVIISFDGDARSGMMVDGTYVLALSDYEPKWAKLIRYGPLAQISRLENRIFSRRTNTLRILETDPYQPASRFVGFGISVCNLVKRLQPSFVFAQQVVRFGFAAALCHRHYPVFAMPYGQDIYRLALSSPLHRLLAAWSLKRIDMIFPVSTAAVSHIAQSFRVNERKIRPLFWGIQKALFFPPTVEEKIELRVKYGIPIEALVVMNARRFDPGWGSSIVTDTFIELAKLHDQYRFVIVGGTFDTSDEEISKLRKRLEADNLAARFLILEHGVSLEIFSELLKLSDIFTSLMLGSDMRSASIRQGAAVGVAPIVTEWPEYRVMEELGFQALFVPMNNVEETVKAVEFYRRNPNKMQQVVAANLEYIAEREDEDEQMELLMHAINDVIESRRLHS